MTLDILKQCIKGEHTMHHNPCCSNCVRSDMFIASNDMRDGHSPWGMGGGGGVDANVTIQIQNKYKGEFSTRILDDSEDRKKMHHQ